MLKKKKVLPLNGNKELSFDTLEILSKKGKKKIKIDKINSLSDHLKKKIKKDLKNIVKRKSFCKIKLKEPSSELIHETQNAHGLSRLFRPPLLIITFQ